MAKVTSGERVCLSSRFQAQPAMAGTPGQRARILCTLRSSEQGKQALCFASFTCSVQEQRRNGGWVFLLNTVKVISHGHTQEPYQVALDSVKLTVSADQHGDSIKGINKGDPKRIKHSQECRAGLQ